MKTNGIMIGGKKNKQLFEAIKGFKILQLRVSKQTNGEGLIEIKGSIDEKMMSLVEKILSD